MRKVAILLLAVFAGAQLWAQTDNDYIEIARSVLKTEKKAAIADAMQLTEAEADVFWPLYNEYTNAEYKIQSKRIQIIRDYDNNFENLTDEKADELWNNFIKYKQELLTLDKKYYKKFKKILPAGKAARYFQAENKLNALINAQLALEIPLLETK